MFLAFDVHMLIYFPPITFFQPMLTSNYFNVVDMMQSVDGDK